jgi:hypothetical protein
MATQGPQTLPPITVQSTSSVTQAQAHEFLAAYLDRAAIDPAFQPNASISEHGPVSRTTAAAPNLTLHNLKRVQAGLAGEILGRDLTVAKQNPGEDYLDVAAGAVKEGAEEAQEVEAEDEDLMMDDAEFAGEAEAFAEQKDEISKEERKRLKKERRLMEKKGKAKARAEAEDSD